MNGITKKGICHIVGAADFAADRFKVEENDFVIAADGGLKTLENIGVKPDMILGDFDSLGYIPDGDEVLLHPVHKDDTDSMLAMREAMDRGYRDFVFHGCTGGARFDHTVANLQTLAYAAENGVRASMYADGYTIESIHNSALRFDCGYEGDLSVFAHGGSAKGVWLSGLTYPLYNAELSPSLPLGVSNSFIGKEASVRVNDGTLIVIWKDCGDLPRPVLID
ncbi:MAG: thiamine diphosphokinase [Clostridia bacterium]|nr:thiamine diphosphokinase [Clostridia bacterium]